MCRRRLERGGFDGVIGELDDGGGWWDCVWAWEEVLLATWE